MITRRRINGNTSAIWTLSGLVLAACGGGGGGVGVDSTSRTSTIATFRRDENTHTLIDGLKAPEIDINNGRMSFRSPIPEASRDDDYRFASMSISPMSEVETVSGNADLNDGEWIFLIEDGVHLPGTDPLGSGWDDWEGDQLFKNAPTTVDMRIIHLGIRLHSSSTLTDENWRTNLQDSDINRISIVADIEQGNTYEGRVEISYVVNAESGENDDDVTFTLAWDKNFNGRFDESGDDDIAMFTVNADTEFDFYDYNVERNGFMNVDISGSNKHLLSYVVGSAASTNFLTWIQEDNGFDPADGTTRGEDGFFTLGDRFTADYFAEPTSGEATNTFHINVIWWYVQEYIHPANAPLVGDNIEDLFGRGDFSYRGERDHDPDVPGQMIIGRPAHVGTGVVDANGVSVLRDAMGYPMRTGTTDNSDEDFPVTQSLGNGNQFTPTLRGRYHVQLVTWEENSSGVIDETINYGLHAIHEIDIHDANPHQSVLDAYTVEAEVI